jgi:hypothetical protein
LTYSIDTSAIIDGWERYYPPDVLPDLWDKNLPSLIAEGKLVASEVVQEELAKKSDEALIQWAKSQQGFYVPMDEKVWAASKGITNAHGELLKSTGGGLRSGGDPFVIGLAYVRGFTVVTGESSKVRKRPSIPEVCEAFDIPWINFLQLIRDQGWRFRA